MILLATFKLKVLQPMAPVLAAVQAQSTVGLWRKIPTSQTRLQLHLFLEWAF